MENPRPSGDVDERRRISITCKFHRSFSDPLLEEACVESSVSAAPPAATTSQPSVSLLERAVAVFARPARAWDGLEGRTQWWFPMLVVVIAAVWSAALLFQ